MIRGSHYGDITQRIMSKNAYGVTSLICDNEARNTINLAVMPDFGLTLLDYMVEKQISP